MKRKVILVPVKLNNFLSFLNSAEKKEKEYYTLGCLLYFLKNEHLVHPKYVQQAAGDKVPVVRRPDRRHLLEYIHGTNTQIPKSIDKTARLEMPTHVKRTAEDKHLDHTGPSAKKQKLDSSKASEQQIKQRLAAKLDAPQDGMLSINRANLKNLSEDLTRDKIAEIRAKVISIRRTRIKPEDHEDTKAMPSLGSFMERSEETSIFSREKQYRTRTTILQSSGKTFSKTVMAILQSVKAREEGKTLKPHVNPKPRPGAPPMMQPPPTSSQPKSLPNYNRYDQEQFHGKDHTHGFNIETTGTFSGMTLRSVTEGSSDQRRNAGKNHHQSNNSNAIKSSIPPSVANSNQPGSGGKRPSRTPIIVIPAAPKSLITMYNAKEALQDLRFVSTEEIKAQAGLKRDNDLLIQRRKEQGLTVPYRVIDNPSKLSPQDWDRVVAVFVMGQVL